MVAVQLLFRGTPERTAGRNGLRGRRRGGGGKDFLQTKLPKDSANRITWIDRDGTVLFDSVAKAEDMENHADRDEVQQAMKTGEGESTRYSSTLSRKTTNYALRLDDGTILRLSGTQYTVVSLLVSQFQALVAVLVLAVGLAALSGLSGV